MTKFQKLEKAVLKLLFSSVGILFGAALFQTIAQTSKTYKFENGNWFDGKSFNHRIFYSVNGFLTKRRPLKIDETVDLKNGFVIPPFADAHTHNLDGNFNLGKMVKAYLDEGTFYVQATGNHATNAKLTRPLLNKPSTLDVVYANAMLTCTYGHPFMVYEPLAMGIYNPADAFKRIEEVKKSRRAENDAYVFLDSKADVNRKWKNILATKPDIIKIALLDAENYEKYLAANKMINTGLSPEIAAYVVEKAHQSNLRVFAHIETANDFRIGVKIGVDGFAHAPYYDWDGKTKLADDLTVADMKLAARKKVVVIPTAARGVYKQTDYDTNGKGTLNQERFGRVVDRYRKLYNEMHRRGIQFAFGLDNYGSTLMPEIQYFHDNQIFDDLTLLKIAVEDTPQVIFPNRRIGRLAENYEASFLVLNGSPLEDFNQIKNISLRFKQGDFLPLQSK